MIAELIYIDLWVHMCQKNLNRLRVDVHLSPTDLYDSCLHSPIFRVVTQTFRSVVESESIPAESDKHPTSTPVFYMKLGQ